MEYVLEMKDISKTFPGVVALDHVQLQVRPGEVHALMGENGAGKSTLMKILMGIYTKDPGGEILFDGKPYNASNPKEAMDMGVSMIHQELNPILDMTVYENIFVGRELRKNGLVDKKAEIEEAQKLIHIIVTDFEAGQVLEGKVVSIKDFGAFLEFAPGKEGMVHISKLSKERVNRVEDVLTLGDVVKVVCLGKDKMGRISFSMKDVAE